MRVLAWRRWIRQHAAAASHKREPVLLRLIWRCAALHALAAAQPLSKRLIWMLAWLQCTAAAVLGQRRASTRESCQRFCRQSGSCRHCVICCLSHEMRRNVLQALSAQTCIQQGVLRFWTLVAKAQLSPRL